jgi:hypothetical protein
LALQPRPPAPATAGPTATSALGQSRVSVQLPQRIFTNRDNAPGKSSAALDPALKYRGISGEQLIPTTQAIRDKISAHFSHAGMLEEFGLYDQLQATGFMTGNIVYVERGPTWEHAVAIMPQDRLHHMYFFSYACGHRASTTPDPYRELMYAQPQHVADKYAKLLCADCQSMRAHLNNQHSTQRAPAGGENAGHD